MSILRAGRSLLFWLCAAILCAARTMPQVWAQEAPAPRTEPSAASELDELSAISAAAAINSAPGGATAAAKGLNASVMTSSQHDSSSGWSSLLTPSAGYRFNRYFSVDAYVPIYTYVDIDSNVGTDVKPVYAYAVQGGVFGDTAVSAEGDLGGRVLDYSGTVSMGLPSGNTAYGLGAGQVTYNINNDFERSFGPFTPDIELGFGDTSSLVDQRLVKSYVAVGPMAHFQAGMAVYLPLRSSFEADAYEELPTAKNLVYSTTGKGKKKVTTATNEDPGEDNGFITSLDIPMTPHLTLSGYYSRSLRDHDDVAGFSFTFLWKPMPRAGEKAQ